MVVKLRVANIICLAILLHAGAWGCPVGCQCGPLGGADSSQYGVECEGEQLSAVPQGIPIHTTDLSISNNRLQRVFPNDFDGLDDLRILYLRNNIIGRIHNETLWAFKKMEKHLIGLDLSGNPLDCSCSTEMRAFVQWLTDFRGPQPLSDQVPWIAIVDGYNTLCATPPALNGRRVDELIPSDICGAHSEL